MEEVLRFLQNIVVLMLAAIGIGAAVRTATGKVSFLRQPLVRFIATVLFFILGLWIFYTGIRHAVSS